jgi:radical SAM-linked protein
MFEEACGVFVFTARQKEHMGQERYVYRFDFDKGGSSIYVSHLDLLRLLGRAARRAELPVVLTEGFHPRMKIKLFRAVKLGVEAYGETGEIVLRERRNENDIRKSWQKELPAGIVIQRLTFAP